MKGWYCLNKSNIYMSFAQLLNQQRLVRTIRCFTGNRIGHHIEERWLNISRQPRGFNVDNVGDQVMPLPCVQLSRYMSRAQAAPSQIVGGELKTREWNIFCRERPELNVCVAGRTGNSILDTGSQVSVLTEECLHQLCTQFRLCHQNFIRLTATNGVNWLLKCVRYLCRTRSIHSTTQLPPLVEFECIKSITHEYIYI